MKTKVIRIGQNTEKREYVDVVLVGHPNWDSARVTVRLPEDAPLLRSLFYGAIVDAHLTVLEDSEASSRTVADDPFAGLEVPFKDQ